MEDLKITNTNEQGEENMKKTENEWTKLMMMVMEYFQLQNELTKLRVQDLSEYIERPCSCPDCIMKALTEQPLPDDEKEWQEFDDAFREEWE